MDSRSNRVEAEKGERPDWQWALAADGPTSRRMAPGLSLAEAPTVGQRLRRAYEALGLRNETEAANFSRETVRPRGREGYQALARSNRRISSEED